MHQESHAQAGVQNSNPAYSISVGFYTASAAKLSFTAYKACGYGKLEFSKAKRSEAAVDLNALVTHPQDSVRSPA